jgi:thiamine biosynthesis lipoprotein
MENQSVFSDSFFAMRTRCDVVFTTAETELAGHAFQLVRNEIEELENRISRYVPDSPLSEINSTEKNIWISVPDDLWDILTICFDFYQMSSGAFDITATALIDLWKNGNTPTENEIEAAKKSSGFDKVEFDFENQKLKFQEDGVEFDLDGIGKGIALDTIKPILIKEGIKNGIVSFGESSIFALGIHPNGEKWPLGIRNSFDTNEFIHLFSASNEIITTSGTILNTDEGEVVEKNSTISPVTGFPVEGKRTVSVKSESATMGEFISTIWLILPENDKSILAEKLKNIEILEVDYNEKNEYKTKLSLLT